MLIELLIVCMDHIVHPFITQILIYVAQFLGLHYPINTQCIMQHPVPSKCTYLLGSSGSTIVQ